MTLRHGLFFYKLRKNPAGPAVVPSVLARLKGITRQLYIDTVHEKQASLPGQFTGVEFHHSHVDDPEQKGV